MAQDFRFVILAVGIVLLFGLTLFVNYLAGAGENAIIPIFETSIGDVSDKYTTPVTPADWTFAIWGLIYTWQFALIAYILSTICRNNANDEPLYKYPPVITYGFLLAYSLNLLTNSAWCFFFCEQKMVYALVVILLSAFTLYVALIDNCTRVYNNLAELLKRYRGDLIANYILIQNGISLYCTWLTIASLISLSIVQIYDLGVDVKTSGTICFTVLAVVILLLTILENTLLSNYLANVYTSWLVIIWALSGNLSAHWNPSDRNAIFAVVLLAFSVVAFLTKLGLRIFKTSKNIATPPIEYKSVC